MVLRPAAAALWFCLALLPAAWAGSMSGPSNELLPGALNSGGRDSASGSHNVIAGAGEPGGSSHSSVSHFLYPGFGNLMAWPAAVSDLTASTGAAPGSIQLRWTSPRADGSTGTAAGYAIRLSSVQADSPAASEAKFLLARSATDFVTVPAPGPAGYADGLTVTGLVGGATYYVAVKARASWDAWGYLSPGATAQARLYAPAVTGFSGITENAMRVDWADTANIPGLRYRVLVSTAPDPLAPAGAVVSSSDTFNLFLTSAGLTANTTYYFRVAGMNGTSEPPVYSVAAATSTLLAFAPTLPSFSAAAENSITFAWSNNGNPNPGTTYRIAYSTADPQLPQGAAVFYGYSTGLSFAPSGLSADTTYYFSVAGVNHNGMPTNYTSAIATSTLANVPVFAGFSDVGPVSMRFNWALSGNRENGDLPGTLYRVAVSTAPDPMAPAGASVTFADTYDLFFSSYGLNSATDYYFRVAAVNNNGVRTAYSLPEKAATVMVNAPVLWSVGTAASGMSNITVAWPSHQAGDIGLLFVESANQAISLGTPNGFVEVSTSPQGTGPGGNALSTRLAVFWARATSSSMASPVVTDPGNHAIGVIAVFRRVAPSGNPWEAAAGGVKAAASASLTVPSTATVTPETLIVTAVTSDVDSISAFASGWTNAGLENIAEVFDAGTTSGNGGGIAVMTANKTNPGLTGNTTLNVNGTGSNSVNAYITLALRPKQPLAPPNVAAIDAVGARDITASWNMVTDATGYTLAASLSPANPPDIYASSTTEGDLSATVSMPVLNPNTTYYLFVRANGPADSSAWSAYLGTSTLVEYEPTAPVFGAVAADSAQVSWSNNGNPLSTTKYRVFVSTAADPLVPDGAVVTASDTYNLSLTAPALAPDTRYYFSVAAVNNNDVRTGTPPPISTYTPLAYPPAFSAFGGVSTGSVRFEWGHNGNAAGTLYRAQIAAAENMAGAVEAEGYDTYLSSAGLPPNTTYYFRVAGVGKGGGLTSYTAVYATATWARAPAAMALGGVGENSITAGWSADGNPYPATRYRVFVSTAADPLNPAGAAVTSSDTYNLSLTTSGLALNTTYYFRAAAINHNGVLSGYSAPLSTSTFAAAPSGLFTSQVSSYAARVDWSQGSNPSPATRYHVLYSTAANPLAPDGAQVEQSYTAGAYIEAGDLEADTSYYFKVAAVSNNGIPTAYADISTATFASQPSGFYFSDASSWSVRLNWSPGGNPYPGTMYRVAVSTAEDPLNPGQAGVSFYNTFDAYLEPDTLAANTTYYFRAAAVNRRGMPTAYAAAESTSTLAAQPSGFYFTGTTQDYMLINWSASGNGPGALYRVYVSTAADPLAPAGAAVTFHETYDTYLSTGGLTYFTDYSFRAAAVNNNGLSTAYTAAVTEKTLAPGEIGSPASGAIDGVFVSSISASWSLVTGATGYTLAASLAPDNPPTAVYASSVTVGNAVTAAYAFEPALAADTTYYLFARANGPMSASAWFAFPGAATRLAAAPSAPVTAQVSSHSVRFAWTGGNPAGTLYRVLTSTADPHAPAGAAVISSDTYNVFLDSSGLAANTTYYFTVTGVNKGGLLTTYTPVTSSSTLAGEPLFTGYGAVENSSMQFGWTDGGNPPGTLYRAAVSTATDPLNPGFAAASSSYTYSLSLSSSGLVPDTTYYFSVAAVNHNGVYTAYTVTAATATRLAYAPAFSAFSGVTAGAVQFGWTDSNPGGTRYRVYVSSSGDPLLPGAVFTSSDTYSLSLSSSGLAPNTTYYFSVAGVNKSNVPTAFTSAASTATLVNQPLSAVSTFSAVASGGFTASWNANANPPGTRYDVEVSTDQDFTAGAAYNFPASTAPLAGASYSFSGLRPYTVYYFRVRAVNRNSVATEYAQLGSTRTLTLPAPAVSAVTSVSTYAVTAAWNLAASATGYTLSASTAPDNPPYPVAGSSVTAALAAETAGLAANTTYYLFVRSEGPGMSSPWAAFPATSTLANAPLSAVTTFTAIGYNNFSVSWDANGNPLSSTIYEVEVSTAYDFNGWVSDRVAFSTIPASGPGASFDALNAGTYYYFRVRTLGHGGVHSAWKELGVARTKVLPTLHAQGDGVVFYGQAANTMPQFRDYIGASNTFGLAEETVDGEAGTLYVIKTNPLQSRQEAVAGYVKDGTLHVLCTDGVNWSEEWTQTVGGDASTRRFDIAYETASGDVLVTYSQGLAASNELGYRTKSGALECGSGNWSAHSDLNATGTSGIVQWVKMSSDRRASSDTIVAIWADAASDLTARIWNGAGWEAEPSSALDTSLEFVSVSQDVENFDAEFESLSGNAMVVWGNSAGTNGTNGMRYARWTEASRVWGTAVDPGATGDDATNIDLAANPNSNEMVVAFIGNAGGAGSADMRGGYWSGSAWTISALDTACQLPAARTKLVAAAWVTAGANTRSVLAYHDASPSVNISWYVGNGSAFTQQTPDAAPLPAYGTLQTIYTMHQDPVNKDRALLVVSDFRNYLTAKRVIMVSTAGFAWHDANGASELETALSTGAVGGFSFAYWPAPPVTTYLQSAYRLFANADSADVGAPLAAQDTVGALPAAGSAFRLRAALHVGQVDLPVNGQGFKLQYAGRGDGTCEAPANGFPSDYTDVTAATLVAYNNNASVADADNLTVNANDPKHGGHTNMPQDYEEANNSTNTVSGVIRNQDALWDFALKDNGMVPGAVYCLRLVKSDDTTLNAYGVYPEVLLHAPVYINEVYPSGADGEDWVELFNNTGSTPSLTGWRLEYVQNTIDLGGTPGVVWTAVAGSTVNASSTFTVTGLTLAGGQSYHLRLLDAGGRVVDQAQWPVLSAGQSFARITDGNPNYFEIDPTPTPGYANYVATDPFKLNEVSYGSPWTQFIEVYNDSAVQRTLAGYKLRSSAGGTRGVFTFDRKIYPYGYALAGFGSVDGLGRTFADAFGPQGLASSGDFLVLENSSGSTVDMLTWQADANYTRYNYKASTVSYTAPAPANAAHSIGRGATEGYDSGIDQTDFQEQSFTTLGSRNNNAASLTSNTLVYPYPAAASQYLARYFPLTLDLGVNSSAGRANTVIFERIGGAADSYSPHVYRYEDIGFNTGSTDPQTVEKTGYAFNDQEGRPLVPGTAYRVTFNSDNGSASAPQIVLGTVTYDSSSHYVSASTAAPQRMNEASRAALVRVLVSNNGPSGATGVEPATVTFRLMNHDLTAALLQQQARDLFNAVMLVRDSTSTGVAGVYEPAIDVATAAYVPMGSITLDSGFSTLTVTGAGRAAAEVYGATTSVFFVVFESTADAADAALSTFTVTLAPSDVMLRDSAGGLGQDRTYGALVQTSSVAVIAQARPPANSAWPAALPAQTVSYAPAAVYTNEGETSVSSAVYVSATDGYVRAFKKDGTPKWQYPTDSGQPVRTSPLTVVEGGQVYLYFADDNGDVYKLRDDESVATRAWKKSVTVPVQTALACSDLFCTGDRFYFGASDNSVRCLMKSDGNPCSGWTLSSAITSPIAGSLVIDERAAVSSAWVGLEDGRMVSLRLSDGYSPTAFDRAGAAIKSSPLLDAKLAFTNNALFFTSTDGKLYARVSSNLEQAPAGWTDYNAGAPIYSSPFMLPGEAYVYFGDEAGRLHKVSTEGVKADGWPFQAGGAIRGMPAMVPAGYIAGVSESYVYFGCDDGYIYAVNEQTGQLRPGWPVATGGPVRADPVVDPDAKTLIVPSSDGKTYVLYIGP